MRGSTFSSHLSQNETGLASMALAMYPPQDTRCMLKVAHLVARTHAQEAAQVTKEPCVQPRS
jgi:hypothetical protein